MISKEQLEEEIQRPEVLRSCYNCGWIIEAMSLWCGNKKAQKARGTSIPGCVHCPYWKPDKSAKRIMRRNNKIDNFMIVG